MLLVAFVYLGFALLGMGCPAWARSDHATIETLHLRSYSRTVNTPAAEAEAPQIIKPSRLGAAIAVIAASRRDAAVFPLLQSTPPQMGAVLANWLGLVIAELSRNDDDQAVLWPDARKPGAILGRWHRSVVLHL